MAHNQNGLVQKVIEVIKAAKTPGCSIVFGKDDHKSLLAAFHYVFEDNKNNEFRIPDVVTIANKGLFEISRLSCDKGRIDILTKYRHHLIFIEENKMSYGAFLGTPYWIKGAVTLTWLPTRNQVYEVLVAATNVIDLIQEICLIDVILDYCNFY